MEFTDGREVLCTLALPLPLQLAGALGRAIADAAERVGYTDVVLLTDGSNRIVATPRKLAAETESAELAPRYGDDVPPPEPHAAHDIDAGGNCRVPRCRWTSDDAWERDVFGPAPGDDPALRGQR